jgi:hypothetical protein
MPYIVRTAGGPVRHVHNQETREIFEYLTGDPPDFRAFTWKRARASTLEVWRVATPEEVAAAGLEPGE